jgi:hypothetical protein
MTRPRYSFHTWKGPVLWLSLPNASPSAIHCCLAAWSPELAGKALVAAVGLAVDHGLREAIDGGAEPQAARYVR